MWFWPSLLPPMLAVAITDRNWLLTLISGNGLTLTKVNSVIPSQQCQLSFNDNWHCWQGVAMSQYLTAHVMCITQGVHEKLQGHTFKVIIKGMYAQNWWRPWFVWIKKFKAKLHAKIGINRWFNEQIITKTPTWRTQWKRRVFGMHCTCTCMNI